MVSDRDWSLLLPAQTSVIGGEKLFFFGGFWQVYNLE